MKGIIKWYMSDSSTGEFSYDISERRFDTSNESIRDTIMNLLCNDWENFGDEGATIIIISEEGEEE